MVKDEKQKIADNGISGRQKITIAAILTERP